jgi:HSP20 family protein
MSIIRREPLGLTRWEPFREMEDMLRQFAPFWSRPLTEEAPRTWRPLVNISETDKEYLIKAELPEVRKEDIKITLEDGVLTLSGERKYENREGEGNDLRVESFYGTFSRSFTLPEDIDASKIEAECKDGVLRIHVPKTQPSKSQPVSIEVH